MSKSTSNKAVKEPTGDALDDAIEASSGHDTGEVPDTGESEPIQVVVVEETQSDDIVEPESTDPNDLFDITTTMEPARIYRITRHEMEECRKDGILATFQKAE